MSINSFFPVWIVLFFLTPLILCGTPEDRMKEANLLLKEKAWDEAIPIYRLILSEGNEGVSLYNNLGLAFYHSGKLPEAVLYFEKALKLSPSNKQVRQNLEVANAAIDHEIYVLEKFFIFRWWESFYLSMHPDFFAVMTLLLIFVFLLAMFALLFRKRTKLIKAAKWVAVLAILLVILFFTAAIKGTRVMKSGDARILMREARAFEKPVEDSEQIYLLKAGSKVWLEESQDGWYKLELINQDTCWVKDISMEKI